MSLSAFAQLVALAALWGASFLFIRIASPQLGPLVLAGLRIGLATLTLALIMRALKHRWPWQDARELLWIALTAVAFPFLLFAWAGLHLPSSYSALINTSFVMFGCVFAAWMKVDTITVRKMAGCLIGLAGIGMIVQLGPIDLTPTVLLACLAALLASACYGIAVPLTKRALSRMEPLPVAAMTHLWSIALLAPLSVYGLPQAKWSTSALLATAVMGRHCLLAASARDAAHLQHSSDDTGLHDPDFRCALGASLFGRTAERRHAFWSSAGLGGDCVDQRFEAEQKV
jgi:drug/metabolite transporter (DMT)-like permease